LLTPHEAGVSRHGDRVVWKRRCSGSGRLDPSKNSPGLRRRSLLGKCDDRMSSKVEQLRWSPLRKLDSPAFSESTRASSKSDACDEASSCADYDTGCFLPCSSNRGESPGELSKEQLDVQFDRIFHCWDGDSKPGTPQLSCGSRAVGSVASLRPKSKRRQFFVESLEAADCTSDGKLCSRVGLGNASRT